MNQYNKRVLIGIFVLCMMCNVCAGCAQKGTGADDEISIPTSWNAENGTENNDGSVTVTGVSDESVKDSGPLVEDEEYILLETVIESSDSVWRTKYTYDDMGRILEVRYSSENLTDGSETSYSVLYNYREDGFSVVTDSGTIIADRICDETGRAVSETQYAADGQVAFRNEYQYGENGYYVKYYTQYDNEGMETYRCIYQYDAGGNILAEQAMDVGSMLLEITESDQDEYTTVYQSTNCLISSATYYFYDDRGRLTRTETNRMWAGISSESADVESWIESLCAECTYDQDGIGTLITYNMDGSRYDRVDMFVNTYDSAGNLIKHETYSSTVTYIWEKLN